MLRQSLVLDYALLKQQSQVIFFRKTFATLALKRT